MIAVRLGRQREWSTGGLAKGAGFNLKASADGVDCAVSQEAKALAPQPVA